MTRAEAMSIAISVLQDRVEDYESERRSEWDAQEWRGMQDELAETREAIRVLTECFK